MIFETALIPAAGAGTRAYPASAHQPKVLFDLAGKPLILRNIEMLRDELGIRKFVVIVGYKGDQVRSALGDGSAYGVQIEYVECQEHRIGLAQGILLAKEKIAGNFVTVLADEVYVSSNHRLLSALKNSSAAAACGVLETADFDLIRRNYSVHLEKDRIIALEEKPKSKTTNLLGLGTYYFTPEIFSAIERTPRSKKSGRVELTDAIHLLAQEKEVKAIFLEGKYFNINTTQDYREALYHVRSKQLDKSRISLVIPAYNEEESISFVVEDFLPHVGEVFVVNNSSKDRTAEVAKTAGARVETVNLTGYGDTIRHGLKHAKGEILVVVEADHTFRSKDLGKLLEYLKDADMVIGSRTTRMLNEPGTNMVGLVRWANIFVGKLLEILWWNRNARFTDIGCTYRAVWKDVYQTLEPNLQALGPDFAPEMMVEALKLRKRIIEVPISYYQRRGGESKHSKTYYHLTRTALKMLRMMFLKRIKSL